MWRIVVVLWMVCGLWAASGPQALAQWEILNAPTTADLRGVASVGGGVVWISGSGGAVLRSEDNGAHWTKCAVPPGGEKLDFRGVQAFDAKTAIVMSSGPGDASRLYKTVDGCGTWKLVFTNPDKEGFWDAVVAKPDRGFLVGDPVNGRFVFYASRDGALETWERFGEKTNILHFPYDASAKEAMFAASNSVAEGDPTSNLAFVTGGETGSRFYLGLWNEHAKLNHVGAGYYEANLPFMKGPSAGAFSLAGRGEIVAGRHYVAVGGDYTKPDGLDGTAAYSDKGGTKWKAAKSLPHGYRSAVAYDDAAKAWIAVGPNGTDVSTDDGRNWRALRPSAGDAADADRGWNALSLPFVVGPKGRVGRLRESVVK